jgi:fluoroquinolone transport system permease protein
MRRLAATVATDLRLQYRNGFYLATAFVLVISIVLVRALPRDIAALFLPVVIIGNVLINAFYFAGGLLLLERSEGTLLAQAVTPLRHAEYLAAKVATLTALCLLEGLLLAAATFGADSWLLPMAVGIMLIAALFCLTGIALVLPYRSINEFLLPSVLYSFALSIPLLGLIGVASPSWYVLHPMYGPMRLLQIDEPLSPPGLIHAIAYPAACIPAVYVWSRRALAMHAA